MADSVYDPFAGIVRLLQALDGRDERALEVIILHVALDAEIDMVLDKLLPRADKLPRDMTSFYKARILWAAWQRSEDSGKIAYDAICAFSRLRNIYAHGPATSGANVANAWTALVNAYKAIDPAATQETAPVEIAQGICSFLGDAPNPTELRALFQGIAGLVDKMGQTLGRSVAPKSEGASKTANLPPT